MPDFGDGSVREDYGAIDPNAPSVANGQITPEDWLNYKRKRKRDAILGMLATLGGTTALGALGGVLGGAGGAASGGALGSVNGLAITPYAGTASMAPTGAAAVGGTVGAGAGAGAAGALGAGGEVLDTIAGQEGINHAMGGAGGIFGNMSGRDIASLIAALTGTVGGALSNRPNTSPTTQTMDPSLQALINMQTQRMQQQQPLYESVLSMANGLLPMQYQNGGRGRP